MKRVSPRALAFVVVAVSNVSGCARTAHFVSRTPAVTADRCGDSIEGVWIEQFFDVDHGEWTRMLLRIRRDATNPNRLAGEIESHVWDGAARDPLPPRCGTAPVDFERRMRASGELSGDRFLFTGESSMQVPASSCERLRGRYLPDILHGRLIAHAQRLEVTDTDPFDRLPVAHLTFARVSCGASGPNQ